MATTYDKASLVMIPSGYKDDKLYSVKPTDGSGDFTFSRDGAGASPATRVNASGLIEKGRENILTYSNDFSNAAWVKILSSVTGGQSGYDGSSDAWLLSKAAASGNLQQIRTLNGVQTLSVYAKAGTLSWIRLLMTRSAGNSPSVFFNLSGGGSVGTTSGIGFIDASIESIGSGWYRCSLVVNIDLVNFRIYPADGDGDVSGTSGNIYIQAAQLESGLVATAPAIETTTAPVSAGLLGDMPRLDYSGGATCPSLLLEPSRTNLIANSEYLASSSFFNNNLTITSNATTSPEGVDNATLVTSNNPTGGVYRLYENSTSAGQAVGTASVFMKYVNNQYCYLSQDNYSGITRYAVFDLINGTNTYVSSGYTATITPYADGWYRCTITGDQNTLSSVQIGLSNADNAYTGNIANGQSVYFWGVQREYNSSYVSSYIPTYGSASTRGADESVKSSATDIIGQSEGTMFVERFSDGRYDTEGSIPLSIEGTGGDKIYIWFLANGNLVVDAFNGALTRVQSGAGYIQDNTNYKVAVSYSSSSMVVYVNGVLMDSASNPNIPTAYDTIRMQYSSGNYRMNVVKQTLLFKEALTNAELAALTA